MKKYVLILLSVFLGLSSFVPYMCSERADVIAKDNLNYYTDTVLMSKIDYDMNVIDQDNSVTKGLNDYEQ